MGRGALIILILSILIFSCQGFSSVSGQGSLKDPDLQLKLVVDGLQDPTSMSFLSPNHFLVLEKEGIVQSVHGYDIANTPALNITSIVNSIRERGLLGIAISGQSSFPDDAEHPDSKIYLYFTERIPNHIHNHCDVENCAKGRIVNSLFAYELHHGHLVYPRHLLSIPFDNGDIGSEHIGGKIIIGPDKKIYITGGDGHPCRGYNDCKNSVETGNLNSKTSNIIGSNATGNGGIIVVSDNNNSESEIKVVGDDFPLTTYYAYGIRNSFGLDFDPITGKLWDTENGPAFGDEINIVEPGFNSGWSKVEGNWPITDYNMLSIRNGNHISLEPADINEKELYDFNGKGKYSSPELSWYRSVGVTALKFYDSDNLGNAYKNDMFVASYSNGKIYHFNLNKDRDSLVVDRLSENKVAYSESDLSDFVFAEGFPPITEIQISPDGYIYFLTYDGSVWKIVKSNK